MKAQQEAHELRLKQRPADGEFTNDGAVKEYTPLGSALQPAISFFQDVPATLSADTMIRWCL